MMKIAISITCFFFQIISVGCYAQQLIDEWRLVKISAVYTHENPNTSEYIYDNAGKLKTINYYYNNNYGKKWDSSALKDFVYDKDGRIVSFTKYDVQVNLQYILTYDKQNRLLSKQISKITKGTKPGKPKVVDMLKYSYKENEIKESRSVPPSEKITDETTYRLDKKGNIIRQERKDMLNMKTEKYVCGDFENNPNPNLFTGAYFYTAIQSKQNGKEGYWEDMKMPEKTESVYDAIGMVKKTVITEKDELNTTTTEYSYTYAKIKSPAKSFVK